MTHTPEMMEQIQKNEASLGAAAAAMNWINAETATRMAARREDLIAAIMAFPEAGWRFSRTKLFAHAISPGCDICGQGNWSCLFINGICNANCFYCPSPQKDTGPPVTNSLTFTAPDLFARYVQVFGIRGVGFSGGEPCLNFDRVLSFLKALGRRVTAPLYKWMYTNGRLIDPDKLSRLRQAGLDELRFDLSAMDYDMKTLVLAPGIIPRVTVEIPAIPEDVPRVKQLVQNLSDSGVSFLNLHQIRCTPHNLPHLMKRGYTFLHGPGVTVMESELAALELVHYILDQQIPLPVNYCAFTFRHQFQQAGARARAARMICKSHETLTPTGFIRSTTPDPSGLQMQQTWSHAFVSPKITFQNPFKEIPLGSQGKIFVERQVRHRESGPPEAILSRTWPPAEFQPGLAPYY